MSQREHKSGALLKESDEKLAHHSRFVGFVLCCLYLVVCLGHAAVKIFWYDELITLRSAALPRWHDVWQIYRDGLDTTSLFSSLLLHVSLKLPVDAEISARLPFIFVYLVVLIGVYLFVRRRYPISYALGAAILPLVPPL